MVSLLTFQEILQVVQLTKFDYRLASGLDEELQKLRCRVNYHALRFTKPIQDLGQKLVLRMRKMAKRFISVHLRFVPVLTCITIMHICICSCRFIEPLSYTCMIQPSYFIVVFFWASGNFFLFFIGLFI